MDYPLTVPGINLLAGKFTDGNPATGVPPSNDSSEWANNVTDSIKNVQALAGLAPVENDPTQMASAIALLCRFKLTAPLTLYVNAATGNDTNNGLTAGVATLTLQAAVNIARSYDTNGYAITISVANGTYSGSGALLAAPMTGGGSLIFLGNPGSPTSVVVNNTAAAGNESAFGATGGGQIIVNGFTVSSVNGPCLFAQGAGSVISYQNIVFANCVNSYHVYSFGGAQCIAQAGTCSITGNALAHLYALQGGTIYNNGLTAIVVAGAITFSGPAFAAAFLLASIVFGGCAISGAVTGTRYSVGAMCLIYTVGGGANYFPGSVAGVAATQGFYG